jgi:hypothetical protein
VLGGFLFGKVLCLSAIVLLELNSGKAGGLFVSKKTLVGLFW